MTLVLWSILVVVALAAAWGYWCCRPFTQRTYRVEFYDELEEQELES